MYVKGNPVRYGDPTGHKTITGTHKGDYALLIKDMDAYKKLSIKKNLPCKVNKGFVNTKIEIISIIENKKTGIRSPVSDKINSPFGERHLGKKNSFIKKLIVHQKLGQRWVL
jgi:hypothetical protein